ncbi:YceD family protein [Foetidibacter luteolus]|uniref:YceD family protein n=1 Tax=Foetidibacter luteolus TaxID=2608880 RepID=UPI00129BA0AF|nr:DUF177 domain-containing protein [Foetidibacter luteolus]
MNNRREFEIAFVGLKPGIHEYEYHVGDKFFAQYGEQDFTNCHADIKLQLDKKTGFMLLKFDIGGSADVFCDRCGNPLTLQLWDEFKIVVKMVDDPEEMNAQEEDPDVYYISRGESHLSVADWIYEFINLSIPMQKVCADKPNGDSGCNQEVLERLNHLKNEQTETHNSIWKGLDQFKNLD